MESGVPQHRDVYRDLAYATITAVLTLGMAAACSFAAGPADPAQPPSVAVLDEPGLPQRGAPASPETIAGILSDGGMRVERLTAAQCGDPSALNVTRFDLLVLPTGETFPIEARENLLAFLRDGGVLFRPVGWNRFAADDRGTRCIEYRILRSARSRPRDTSLEDRVCRLARAGAGSESG